VVGAVLARLTRQVPTLFAPSQEAGERARLAQAFAPAKTQFQRLEQALSEVPRRDR
jgi:hypothetical protein